MNEPNARPLPTGHAGPVGRSADQLVLDGVGEGVDGFFEDGIVGGEFDGGIGALGPNAAFMAPQELAQAPSQHEVEAVHEGGEVAVEVGEDEMVVIGKKAGFVETDAGGDMEAIGEAILDDGIDGRAGTKEESTFGGAAGDEVGFAGEDRPRLRHILSNRAEE